jgi:hypothetical protein
VKLPGGPRKIWFPAKTYGWGWGPPVCWQGWAVVFVYIAAACVGAMVILSDPRRAYWYFLYMLALTAALIAVSWWKGEKPGWRWGEKTADSRESGADYSRKR